MFEEIIREVEKLSKPRPISISMPLDEKGFFDRECPNPECEGAFKVLFQDWRDKISDERVFCPFCKHEAKSDQWHTEEQVEHIRATARAEMARLFQGALRRGVEQSRPTRIGGGLFSINMSLKFSPGHIPAVIPAAATDTLRQEFTCDMCGCHYASVGASFFCPACGHNSATSSFDTTLGTVEKTVNALEQMRATLEQTVDADTAHDAVRQLLEDQYPRLVGAFERLNEALFERLPNASTLVKKGAVFQRIDDASALWQQVCGCGYGDFLSASELHRLKMLFQRRHVLSHQQGIVDQTYLDRSGDLTYKVGQRLVVREEEVIEFVALMRKLTTSLRGLVP